MLDLIIPQVATPAVQPFFMERRNNKITPFEMVFIIREIMYEVQEILKDDACSAPLYYEMQTYGCGADVDGFIIYPNENVNMAYMVRK